LATSVKFWADASLVWNGSLIERKGLSPSQHGYIRPYPDSSYIIGEALFILPEPSGKTTLTLELTGSYFANFNGATYAPSLYGCVIGSAKASRTFEIKVIKK
jgi:hypothetical protein